MYDIIIQGGKIIDGQNTAPYTADIAISGDEIVKIGRIEEDAKRIIDARGKIVTPGFIDIHCHSDAIVFHSGKNPLRLQQGFTTEVIGNCGISPAPVNPEYLEPLRKYCNPFFSNVPLPYTWQSYGEYLDAVAATEPLLNIVGLVGHGALRIAISGFEDRALSEEELQRMEKLLDESLKGGAFGMSSGLIYPPGVFANQDKEEIFRLARVVADNGGIYASHMRSESSEVLEAVQESIAVAEKTGVSLEISHHKAQGVANRGKTRETLRLIAEANARGLRVNCDVYPYDAASTQFSACLPPWSLEGGVDKLISRLSDAATREKILADMKKNPPEYENFFQYAGSWERVLINECSVKAYEGKSVQAIAEENGADPYEMALDIIRNSENNVMMIVFTMDEEDISRVIYDPHSVVCSDGFPGLGPYHPRYTSAFIRLLEKYVKEDHLLSLQQAIYKITGMPAAKLGLKDRGSLAEGMKADILVLDMETLHDNSSYQNYSAGADGVDFVLINGQLAVDNGERQPVCAGRVLKRS